MPYHTTDHLSSANLITNQSGAVVQKLDYLPFGEERLNEQFASFATRFTYTDQERDDESGLLYYGARYYNPQIGRFTQPDPVLLNTKRKEFNLALQNPQLLNAYSYVGNNPLKYVDEDGEWGAEVAIAIGIVGLYYLGKNYLGMVWDYIQGDNEKAEENAADAQKALFTTGTLTLMWLKFVAFFGLDSVDNVVSPDEDQPNEPWLQHHEQLGGHTIREHIGLSDVQLAQRLQGQLNIPAASTFPDQETAEQVISAAINENRNAIQNWLRNTGTSQYELDYIGPDVIGRTMQRGSQIAQSVTNARVVLEREGSGFYIKTAFPTP